LAKELDNRKKITYKQIGQPLSEVPEIHLELLSQFNAGSRDAFTKVYNLYYPSAFYFAKRFVTTEEAEDITADVFCKLWNMHKHFAKMQSVKVFLQISIRNACFGFLEHKAVVERHKNILLHSTDEQIETLFYADEIKTEFLQRIFTEMEKLPEQCKKICKLAWFDGMKNREIAEHLHISEKTVCNQKVHGLKLLRIGILAINVLFQTIWNLFLIK
jgi:RNA polymerase sigma-70 factor (family 1)